MLVVFPPIFVVDTKIIYGYNFVALLINNCFLSSSTNAKQKFWGVPDLLHICVIFFYIKYFLCGT